MASDLSLDPVMEPAGFFVVRAPALPFSTLTEWSVGVEAPRAAAADLDEVLARDRALLGSRLRALSSRADVANALLVASPDLVRATTDGDAPNGDIPKTVSARARIALVRYVSRMASRPTPFGLFAACGVGDIGPRTSLSIPPRETWRQTTTLDGGYLEALLVALCESPELRDRLLVRPNGTITRVAGRLRLVRWRPGQGCHRHHAVEVRPTPELERALDAARGGARVPDIAAAVAAPGPTQTRELDFVRALVKAQILVADLQVQLTGATPLDALIADLGAVGGAGTTAELLGAARAAMDRLDVTEGGADALSHSEIGALLGQIPVMPAPDHPCHVVLSLPPDGSTLSRTTAGDIERGARLLARIAPVEPVDELAEFKLAFVERYGQRQVPLAEAVDDRIGVGFGTPKPDRAALLDGLLRTDSPTSAPFTTRDAALLALVLRAAATGGREVALEPDDIDALAAASPCPVPTAFAATVSLADTARGPQILFDSCAGPSGLQALGRFCHADPQLAGLVRRHLRAEAALDAEAVYAEIVHLSGGTDVNFLARPLLREWEIEWLGRSGAARDRRLSTCDLLVSVRDDHVVLTSRRLGRRVVPRLTTAHNWVQGTPAVYRFLCSLQAQDRAGALLWDWGQLLSAAFLPRVRWGRLVFSRARWRLAASELERSDAEPWRAVQGVRAKRGLPRWVVAVERDNELTVDLDNVLSVDSFAQLVRNRGSVIVKEMFPGPDELSAKGADGPYVHQLIVPFLAKAASGPAPARATAPDAHRASQAPAPDSLERSPSPRIFAPCAEWVVLELNSGTELADRLLLEMVAPCIDALLADGATDCWYFTRLNQRLSGVTVHTHGKPDVLIPALRGLAARALDAGTARDASFRTHVQQASAGEQIDGPTAAEQLAQVDSGAALELLSTLGRGDRRQDDRWRVCLAGVDRWLCDVGFDLDQRLAHAQAMGRVLGREQKVAPEDSSRLGERFRAERLALGRLLAGPEAGDPLAPCTAVLDRRSAQSRPIIAGLRHRREPTQAQQELAGALVSGWVNRIVRSRDHAHEWAIYALLTRLYQASVHRGSAPRRDRADTTGVSG